MNPDEALGGVAAGLDDIKLVAHDPAADGMAADCRAGFTRGTRGGPQDLGLTIGYSVVAGAELNEAGWHAALLDLAVQLAQHPLAQGVFRGGVRPIGHPRLAVDAGRHN